MAIQTKLLSLVIPSYNMENYLVECISSLLLENNQNFDKLEIIIVNDGSKDNTYKIAQKYAIQNSRCIRLIDKENGHYGSCINSALKVATGKYFRILDADDWFNTTNLDKLLSNLETVDVDVIFTQHTYHLIDEDKEETPTYKGLIYNEILNLECFEIPQDCLKMHCLTYRTEFLKSIRYTQTEGVCYTDNEYVVIPMIFARDFYAFDFDLYQYRIGRGEQSVSIKSMINNVDHYIKVLERLIDIKTDNTNRLYKIKYPIIQRLLLIIMDVFLLYKKATQLQAKRFFNILSILKSDNLKLFKFLMNYKIKGVPLCYIWYKSQKFYYSIVFPLVKQS